MQFCFCREKHESLCCDIWLEHLHSLYIDHNNILILSAKLQTAKVYWNKCIYILVPVVWVASLNQFAGTDLNVSITEWKDLPTSPDPEGSVSWSCSDSFNWRFACIDRKKYRQSILTLHFIFIHSRVMRVNSEILVLIIWNVRVQTETWCLLRRRSSSSTSQILLEANSTSVVFIQPIYLCIDMYYYYY